MVVVTTDKCYENREWPWAYRERDRLGGHDPYSASKAGAELVAASYRTAFLQHPSAPLLATARGGNVIGGGDWSEDRLIPDLVRSVSASEPLDHSLAARHAALAACAGLPDHLDHLVPVDPDAWGAEPPTRHEHRSSHLRSWDCYPSGDPHDSICR